MSIKLHTLSRSANPTARLAVVGENAEHATLTLGPVLGLPANAKVDLKLERGTVEPGRVAWSLHVQAQGVGPGMTLKVPVRISHKPSGDAASGVTVMDRLDYAVIDVYEQPKAATSAQPKKAPAQHKPES